MGILPITVFGDKILRSPTEKVKKIDDEIIQNIQDMFVTMRNANGIGLASNQVGLNKSIFITDISIVEDYENIKPTVFINPEIIEYSDELEIMEEGCLSLPNLKADVERPESIKVKYLDTDENEQIIEADELFARVILHEYDHLIGKMIPDRVETYIKKQLDKELKLIKNRNIEVNYPITDLD